MEFPALPSLPRIPTFDEMKDQAIKTAQSAQAWLTEETSPTPDTAAPENDNQVNTERQAAEFEPTGFQMPTRNEPTPRELLQGVQRMLPSPEDQQAVETYASSQSQYDSTDPKAFALETAAGYGDYLPAAAQKALSQELAQTYQQATDNDLRYVMDSMSSQGFSELSEDQQSRVLGILRTQGTTESLLPEIQGQGGGSARSGTASGEAGHYVNSPITSMSQLISEGKVDDRLLDSLERLQGADNLAPELASQRQEIVSSTLQNIAFPERIAQHSKGTCAATRIEMMLAMEDPAKYTDSVRRLASEGGRTRVGSAYLERVPGTASVDDSGRSVASRLMQPALMEYANGRDLDYSNQDDRHHVAQAGSQHLRDNKDGLTLSETQRLVQGTLGSDRIVEQYSIFGENATDREAVVAGTEALMAQDHGPLLVDLDWGDNGEGGNGGHALLLSHLDEQSAFFMNPWGSLDSMPRAEFDQRLRTGIALADPPALPPRAEPKSNYKPLEPGSFENEYQRELRVLISTLRPETEKIEDPKLKTEVQDFMKQVDTKKDMYDLASVLLVYLKAQGNEDRTEEYKALMKTIGQTVN